MKRILTCVVVCAFLAACGGKEIVVSSSTTQTVTTTVAEQEVVTDTSEPTSTVPLISQSVLPPLVACPFKKISADTKETFSNSLTCASDWAVGWPKSVLDNMSGEVDSEGEWVLKKSGNRWEVLGVCNVFEPIYISGATCSNPYNDDPVNIGLVPPMPVQCVLWTGARFKDSIAETGCPNPL